jgi:hypothetical protein
MPKPRPGGNGDRRRACCSARGAYPGAATEAATACLSKEYRCFHGAREEPPIFVDPHSFTASYATLPVRFSHWLAGSLSLRTVRYCPLSQVGEPGSVSELEPLSKATKEILLVDNLQRKHELLK